MAGQLHRDLALAIFGGLERKSAGRQSIFQAHSHHTAVCPITNPPDVLEVGLQQVPSRRDFRGIGGADVRRSKSQLDCLRRRAKSRKAHGTFPGVQVLQLHHIDGAVVHVLAHVGVGRNAGNLDAASSGAHNIRIFRSVRC